MIAIGFILGFIGYLPLGNINLTVVQLSVGDNKKKVWLFILFAALMEFVYCFACLSGMQALLQQTQLVVVLNWMAVFIFALLGILSLLPSKNQTQEAANTNSARRGVLVAIFNPLQVPFWMVWGVYVMENGWVKREWSSIALFSLLCAFGTIAVLWFYAVAGKKLVERLKVSRNALNRFIGILLLLLAVLQTIKNLQH